MEIVRKKTLPDKPAVPPKFSKPFFSTGYYALFDGYADGGAPLFIGGTLSKGAASSAGFLFPSSGNGAGVFGSSDGFTSAPASDDCRAGVGRSMIVEESVAGAIGSVTIGRPQASSGMR